MTVRDRKAALVYMKRFIKAGSPVALLRRSCLPGRGFDFPNGSQAFIPSEAWLGKADGKYGRGTGSGAARRTKHGYRSLVNHASTTAGGFWRSRPDDKTNEGVHAAPLEGRKINIGFDEDLSQDGRNTRVSSPAILGTRDRPEYGGAMAQHDLGKLTRGNSIDVLL